ncbi:MAG: 3-phosphoserine/phosphohydroxythreonine transaminase [Myxococcota bacterium]
MSRVINFSPGPATLPLSVLEEIQTELVDFQGSGISMLEHSHRGKQYTAVHEETTALLKELLAIPDTHDILYMQGGASGQFALVPMNFLQGKSADYVDTGTWSKKAFAAAKSYGDPRWAGTGKEGEGYVRAPMNLELSGDAQYVHLTSNATIAGVQYHDFPEVSTPLVADMSSDILWRPIDVSKFGLIYAGAQKNLGPAGVTIVIIRKDWMEQASSTIPDIFRYPFISSKGSTQNTPPTFPIYTVGKVLQWVKANGGAAGMETRNRAKAETLYGFIDSNSDFFRCPVEKGSRSVMNAVFRLPSEELEKQLIQAAADEGMVNIKGHRSVGGIRVSMYNAMDPANVDKLVAFMKDFAAKNG